MQGGVPEALGGEDRGRRERQGCSRGGGAGEERDRGSEEKGGKGFQTWEAPERLRHQGAIGAEAPNWTATPYFREDERPRVPWPCVNLPPMPSEPANSAPNRLIVEVEFGDDVVVRSFTNIYGCRIGSRSQIGTFVEIQRGAEIGADCKIQSHSFICEGVKIGDGAFIGHGVVFINDKLPRSTTDDGVLKGDEDWELLETEVGRGAAVGSAAVILGGVKIGDGAMVGAGSVVTRDVPAGATVVGNPAREIEPAA